MVTQQEFHGSLDLDRMGALAWTTAAENIHVIDLPYRLSSWALDEPKNVGLWEDENHQLVAWAVLQTPFWTVDLVFRPEFEKELLPGILTWVDGRAQEFCHTTYGHPSWYINIFTTQATRRRILEECGYINQSDRREDSWSKVWMERPATTLVPAYPLPKGFTLRSLAGEAELMAYVTLHQATFETKNMTLEWRRRTLQQPAYVPDLDVVACAPNGHLAAFCIGWLGQDEHGALRGQIEPLGCLGAYRNYALGRLALCEVLRRMQAHGAQKIYVETDNYRNTAFRLYDSLDFRVVNDILVFSKDFKGFAR